MDVLVRRLQVQEIDQVIEIEREAFSPLWISTPFKRELNNRYACYLVACQGAEAESPIAAKPEESRSLWSRVVTGAQRLVQAPHPGLDNRPSPQKADRGNHPGPQARTRPPPRGSGLTNTPAGLKHKQQPRHHHSKTTRSPTP